MTAPIELDALIVGAGFSGVYQLKRLRDEGFQVKLVESGTDFGGVWHWNRYPGARVDSTIPHYEFSDPDLWTNWTWSQRFPGGKELRAYFAYVAEKWELRKDTLFDSFVTSAVWDAPARRWEVTTEDGKVFRASYFLPNTGFAAKRHVPEWEGVGSFAGKWIHPAFWPEREESESESESEMAGKRIAVIGTGSTGIQLVQDLAPVAAELTLFQRTPNLALPMRQEEYPSGGQGPEQRRQAIAREEYGKLFAGRTRSYGGFDFSFLPRATFDDTPDVRERTYQELWDHGDFHFWLATYQDTLFVDEANTEAYNFWRDKVRARLHDPRLQEKFAPATKPHAFGCKRVSLENGFYELFQRPHVHLVDVNETPIEEVVPNGIRTSEKVWGFDYVICATGFDAVTGGILQMNVVGEDGQLLNDKWKAGVKTYMGLCIAGFPNMFFTYGPQAPTAFCNGPSCAELQGEWVVNVLKHMRNNHRRVINASVESEEAWVEGVWAMANASLLPSTKSWYMGDNIPGKTREPLIYLGGVPTYYKTIQECAANGYNGFVVD